MEEGEVLDEPGAPETVTRIAKVVCLESGTEEDPLLTLRWSYEPRDPGKAGGDVMTECCVKKKKGLSKRSIEEYVRSPEFAETEESIVKMFMHFSDEGGEDYRKEMTSMHIQLIRTNELPALNYALRTSAWLDMVMRKKKEKEEIVVFARNILQVLWKNGHPVFEEICSESGKSFLRSRVEFILSQLQSQIVAENMKIAQYEHQGEPADKKTLHEHQKLLLTTQNEYSYMNVQVPDPLPLPPPTPTCSAGYVCTIQ
jgi:hypothetical protein